MTIHPLYPGQDVPAPQQTSPSQEGGDATAYDSVWSQTEMPPHQQSALERVMLAQDKLYVVLAVVLIIWIGLAYFLLRTDRKLDRLERAVESRIPASSHDAL